MCPKSIVFEYANVKWLANVKITWLSACWTLVLITIAYSDRFAGGKKCIRCEQAKSQLRSLLLVTKFIEK